MRPLTYPWRLVSRADAHVTENSAFRRHGSLKRHGGLRAQNAPDAHSRPSGRRATIPGGTDVYDARTTRTERVWVPGDTPWPMRYLAVISQLDVCMRDRARYREQCTGTPAVMWSCEQLIHHANVSGAPGNSPRRPRRRSRRAARFCRITRPKSGHSAESSVA